MSKEYYYYKVTGGAVRAAYERWLAVYKQQKAARDALAVSFGASGTYANRNVVKGLVFEEGQTPPDGWRTVDGERTVFAPYGPGKAAKDIRKRFREHPLHDATDLQDAVIGKPSHFRFMDGMCIRFMTFELLGDQFILLVPKVERPGAVNDGESGWEPPDDQCVALKTSEYWQLKEAEEDCVKKA